MYLKQSRVDFKHFVKIVKKKKTSSITVINRVGGGNELLKDFTPRQLIEELKARGYKGKLYYTNEIVL